MARSVGIDAVPPLGSIMMGSDCALYMSSPTEDGVDLVGVLACGLRCWMRRHVSFAVLESCV